MTEYRLQSKTQFTSNVMMFLVQDWHNKITHQWRKVVEHTLGKPTETAVGVNMRSLLATCKIYCQLLLKKEKKNKCYEYSRLLTQGQLYYPLHSYEACQVIISVRLLYSPRSFKGQEGLW